LNGGGKREEERTVMVSVPTKEMTEILPLHKFEVWTLSPFQPSSPRRGLPAMSGKYLAFYEDEAEGSGGMGSSSEED
jgi:hypothetical protein